MDMYIYIVNVPCFHSFAERSKELCRCGIKSLNNATMKEGSIGTRNCTVNTEKNVVARRMVADEGDERVKKERGSERHCKKEGTDRKKDRKRARRTRQRGIKEKERYALYEKKTF